MFLIPYPNCCAGKVLQDIQFSRSAPEALDFVAQTCSYTSRFGENAGKRIFTLPGFIAFAGVEQIKSGGVWRTGTKGRADGLPVGYCKRLANYITKHKLGVVVMSPPQVNPVHPHRKVSSYVWNIDAKAFEKWVKTRKKLV